MSPAALEEFLFRMTQAQQNMRRDYDVISHLARRQDDRQVDLEKRIAELERNQARWQMEHAEATRKREAEYERTLRYLGRRIEELAAEVERLEAAAQPQRSRPRKPAGEAKKAIGGAEVFELPPPDVRDAVMRIGKRITRSRDQ